MSYLKILSPLERGKLESVRNYKKTFYCDQEYNKESLTQKSTKKLTQNQ